MKKLLAILVLSLALNPCHAEASTRYTLYGTAYNAVCSDCGNQFVEIHTDDGNIWHMTDVELADGQRVKLRMDSLGTESVIDDEIIKIKKVGMK